MRDVKKSQGFIGGSASSEIVPQKLYGTGRYHRRHVTGRLRFVVRIVASALVLVASASTAARAADPATFARAIATQYHVDARHVVTADIDRDGDLDVLAATDDGFMVWVNDGRGQFTSQAPSDRPVVDVHESGDSWSDDESRGNETIQASAAPIPIDGERAHAPVQISSRPAVEIDGPGRDDASRGSRTPRAPPARS